jgi:CRISPR/Cas system-associated exonuclease Cas4 (RecB family)
MAIKGFACPYGQGDVRFELCLEHSRSDPPECGFTYPILAGIVGNLRGEMKEVTVTQVLNCVRKPALERRHDVYLDPRQLYYAFRGQMFHQIAAGVEMKDCVVEQRFKRVVAGVTLSGQPDLIVPDLRKLYDFKTARRIPKDGKPYAAHGLQVNIYRWLTLPHCEIDQLEIVYLDMSNVLRVPVDVMSVHKVLSWLVPRVKKLRAALDSGPLPPRVGPDGLWQCNGYCSFTDSCWPKGVPTPKELRRKEETKRKAIIRAVRTRHPA